MHFCARNGDSFGLGLLLMHIMEPAEALSVRNKIGRDVWSYIDSPILKAKLKLQTSQVFLSATRSLRLSAS